MAEELQQEGDDHLPTETVLEEDGEEGEEEAEDDQPDAHAVSFDDFPGPHLQVAREGAGAAWS